MMNPLEILKSSSWFDRCWYRTTYPDVAQARMDEEEHYLRVGEPQGWKPCPDFDGKWYLQQYPDVARAGISPLVHFILHGEHEGRMPGPLESPALEEDLWRGAADDQTLERLTELTQSDSRREAEHASFALARWYAWKGDWQQVLQSFEGARFRRTFSLPGHAACVLEIEALSRCGRFDEAAERLKSCVKTHQPSTMHICWPRIACIFSPRRAPRSILRSILKRTANDSNTSIDAGNRRRWGSWF